MPDDLTRVFFDLEPDEDEIPESSAETMWAYRRDDGAFELANVPIHVTGIAPGDIFAATADRDGLLHFDRVVEYRGGSVVQVAVSSAADADRLSQAAIDRWGAQCEEEYPILAIGLDRGVDWPTFRAWLFEMFDGTDWGSQWGHIADHHGEIGPHPDREPGGATGPTS